MHPISLRSSAVSLRHAILTSSCGVSVLVGSAISAQAGSFGSFAGSWAWEESVADDGSMYVASLTSDLLRVFEVTPDGSSHATVISTPSIPYFSGNFGSLLEFARLSEGAYACLFDVNGAYWLGVLREGEQPPAPILLAESIAWNHVFADPAGDIYLVYQDASTNGFVYSVRSAADPSVVLDSGPLDGPSFLSDAALAPDGTLHLIYFDEDAVPMYQRASASGAVLFETPLPESDWPQVLKVSPTGDAGIFIDNYSYYTIPAGGTALQGPVLVRQSARPLGAGNADFNFTSCGDVFVCWTYAYLDAATCYTGWSVRYALADGTLGPIINMAHGEWSGCTSPPIGVSYYAVGEGTAGELLFQEIDGAGSYQTVDVDCEFDTSGIPSDSRVYLGNLRAIPNPVSPGAAPRLELRWPEAAEGPIRGDIEVGVFDAGGRLVYGTTLGAGGAATREYAVELPASLPAGVYRARATSGDVVLAGTVTIVR